jgi:DNA-binding MarR family transcriptional regulator
MIDEIFKNAPFIAFIHNMSKNQLKYLNSRLNDLNLGHDIRYIMIVYENPGISQDDLVNISGQSKGNIAKIVRKLEDGGYIKREVNPENRRKYMLKTTSKANELVPKIRQISKDWERDVGLTPADDDLKQRIKEISINSMKLIGEC